MHRQGDVASRRRCGPDGQRPDAVQEHVPTGGRVQPAAHVDIEEIAARADVLPGLQEGVAERHHVCRIGVAAVRRIVQDGTLRTQVHIDVGTHQPDPHVALHHLEVGAADGLHVGHGQVVDRQRRADVGVRRNLPQAQHAADVRAQGAGRRDLRAQRGIVQTGNEAAAAENEIAVGRDGGIRRDAEVRDRSADLQADIAAGTRTDVFDAHIAVGLQRRAGHGVDGNGDWRHCGRVRIRLDVDVVDHPHRDAGDGRPVAHDRQHVIDGGTRQQFLLRLTQGSEAA